MNPPIHKFLTYQEAAAYQLQQWTEHRINMVMISPIMKPSGERGFVADYFRLLDASQLSHQKVLEHWLREPYGYKQSPYQEQEEFARTALMHLIESKSLPESEIFIFETTYSCFKMLVPSDQARQYKALLKQEATHPDFGVNILNKIGSLTCLYFGLIR